ncbi:hypothetical protein H2198_000238 [Neophaeococcomyces mojaviensis]|uniref:Uncharacterized protein n=1 Tax=Neophaeococcomyces mojaviensis TaxID=3383035 RepID=A0ACC3AK42_9EURO|nr:hypothetical protein H2198_000238 [Knufia sp. JES_112]
MVDVPPLPPLSGLVDRADTLRPAVDSDRVRGKSPARRFKDVFSRSGKSPRTSPERHEEHRPGTASADLRQSPSMGFGERRQSHNPEQRGPSPLRAQTISVLSPAEPKSAVLALQTQIPATPRTPPGAIRDGPLTTVTPPTPTDHESRGLYQSPALVEDSKPLPGAATDTAATNTEDTTSHRRVRSASGALHQRSKLSMSMVAPLTPTIEETRTPSPSGGTPGSRNVSGGGGFFSSWMSAAQNAANSITNLTNQNKGRAGTGPLDQHKAKVAEEPVKEKEAEKGEVPDSLPKKELAVNTLGSGDLNLSHLGIDAPTGARAASPARSETFGSGVRIEDDAARMEDLLAKRAVSQAYERPNKSGEATPVAEVPDPVASVRPATTFDPTSGTLTPPNGSIFEGETSGVKRTNSVRSKLQNRRSRGSSVATGHSTIGAMIGASTATVANPATGPKLSGFAIAPKQRNRAFHQQFRSVPEDDFLIEDYSCALQKEILLAGRLYISEGHICFSSNILGWITTLIISFEEIVGIEKENTAIVIPNAIAVQTLHARHIFRSLLSREATYDLMIGIWRVSHPDSFQKSMNGKRLAAGEVSKDNVTTNGEAGDAQGSEDETDEESGSDNDDGSEPSIGSSGSIAGSEFLDSKSINRNPSTSANGPGPTVAASAALAAGEATSAVMPTVAATDAAQDFPGPTTHTPTECTDSATHYDKIIKDEVIPAPLGKVYSLLYGPQSTAFVRKFLVDGVSKAQDLQLEEDKKGLDNDTKSRQYRYIKPLGGSIGPRQTNCITTENLDFFDLEKAVSVTCTTQTPDVPSGSAFSTKTRYCLTWAPGNATRFQMNMTIEWTAKSWLKGPIEKGALDGQTQYGDDLVKTLKGALGRSRAATMGSKVVKGKKKKKSSKRDKSESAQAEAEHEESWGPLDFLRPLLGPIVAPARPFVKMETIVTILAFMVLWMWFRGPTAGSSAALSRSQRLQHMTVYDDLWRREESELWEWLQDRAGVDGSLLRDRLKDQASLDKDSKQKAKQRQRLLRSKDIQIKLGEEKKSRKEMEEAVRVTQERLDMLQRALEKQRNGVQ